MVPPAGCRVLIRVQLMLLPAFLACLALAALARADDTVTACVHAPGLKCQHGSLCQKGHASYQSRHDHLDLPTHEGGYHCACPQTEGSPGYIGPECGTAVRECLREAGDKKVAHSCYHGSECREVGGREKCDCEALNAGSGGDQSKFAGLMCEHESTAFCSLKFLDPAAPAGQFCTNHGSCVRLVSSSAPHPGCRCGGGWTGDHCEIQVEGGGSSVDKAQVQLVGDGDEGEGGVGVEPGTLILWLGPTLGLIILSIIVLSCVLLARKKRRDQKQRQKDISRVEQVDNSKDLASDGDSTTVDSRRVGEGDLDADGSATLGLTTPGGDEDDEIEII